MPGIIQLLPDNIANQIAAGEVIQRPASAVKELLENAIDAGATKIRLTVKDAGRTLVQVSDNGCGMNESDARLSFERHATSKIKSSDDLYNLYTKGFRGEALASIAAVAQVELRTKRNEDQLGTMVQVEASEVVKQEPVACADGTTISMKNLFFNVPARRNFLKTDQVELKHIIEEFQRVVLVHPEIEFSFSHNGDELFHLPATNPIPAGLRQRLVNFFGKSINEKLVPVETETDLVKVHGFVFKPESCKKVRGDQFFFVNHRFIKSPSLYHAVQNAYTHVLPPEHFAGFFLYLEVPPATLDVNIHPTKTEVKFEHERDIYTILNAAVRQALGKHNMIPSIDFNRSNEVEFDPLPKNAEIKVPTIRINPAYNPFHTESKSNGSFKLPKEQVEHSFETFGTVEKEEPVEQPVQQVMAETSHAQIPAVKLFGKYLIAVFETKALVIHIRRAYERVYFEFLQNNRTASGSSQQLLFPETIQLSPVKFSLYSDIKQDLVAHGFELSYAGEHTLNITGVPAILPTETQVAGLLEQILDEADQSNNGLGINVVDIINRKLAYNVSLQKSKVMKTAELQEMVADLMRTTMPTHTPAGLQVFYSIDAEEIERKLS
jgi:DNA mismatch repair protein MutL